MKRFLSVLLVLVMLTGMLPMNVFATEVTDETQNTEPTVATEATEGTEVTESSNPAVEVTHEHEYVTVVTDPTCTEQGYTTYTCACGDSYVADFVDVRPLNILMIGNSFSWDAADFWYDMQTSMTYDAMKAMLAEQYDVHLAVMYKGSATLGYHATCAANNTGTYTFQEIGPETNYVWRPSDGKNANNKILEHLQERDWDVIVIQSYQHEADGTPPRSTYTGGSDKFIEPSASLGFLLDYFAQNETGAEVYYYMPWSSVQFYGADGTAAGYEAIGKYSQEQIIYMTGTTSGKKLAGIIPVGTAIENARTTYLHKLRYTAGTGATALLKDPQIGLLYDNQHLSFGVGRYIAGLTVAQSVIPQEMRKTTISWPSVKESPSVGILPEEYSEIARKAVENAMQNPYVITPISGYDADPAKRVSDEIAGTAFTGSKLTDEVSVRSYLEATIQNLLASYGDTEYSLTIREYELKNGEIWNLEAEVTVRIGYSTHAGQISVTEGSNHQFGEWVCLSVPTADGLGLEQRVCARCGYVESKEVEGSWQKYDLANHLQELPENYCAETNLWNLLKPESVMINHLGDWVSAGATVYSVTIPVKPGDRIYANSFGVTDNKRGIQVSFIGNYGIIKTTFSSGTYKEFTNNGGYLIAPEGTIAVNVPVWNYKSENTLKILNREHQYIASVTAPTCTEKGYTTYTCACGDSYVADFVDAAGEHSYENGVCTGCGANAPVTVKPMSMRYDDHLDMSGKTVEIIDAGTPTSYQVGYGVEENKVLDTAVVTLKGDTLAATGIGTAKVKIDGEVYEITVTAAPISLFLLIGQSNMEGNEGEAKQSIVCPDGMVYATYGDRYDMVLENATHYAPSALTGEYRTVNTVGGTDGLSDYPVYMLTDEGDGRKGPDSGFAYEWVKQTGEKVWIVNAAHGGTSLDVWQPGTTQYEECEAMFGACQETLRKEIAAGHFTLSHMAYFWCQGCNDYNKTAEWYVEKYLSMHESLNAEMAFDHDGDTSTPTKEFEFAGIIPVRAGHSWSNGYRAGTHTDSTNKSSYESFVDLQMTGPRVAQYWMCNNPELEDIVLVCNIGEDWVWMPDGTNGVSAYFNAHYPNGTVDYTTQVRQAASWYKPTTPNAVHDSIHYNQIGYNEVGRESVRNALIYLGINPDYEEETTVKFVDWTGYKEVSAIEAATAGSSGTLVVPIVSPVTRSKTISYTLSEGLSYKYYDLLANSVNVLGQLGTANDVGFVSVTPRSLDRYTWNFDGTNLVSDPAEGDMNNPLTLLGGSITDGLFNGIRYKISRSICLNHDSEWGVELKISDWSATAGSMIFSGGSAATTGQPYVYFRPTDFFVGFGYYDGTRYNNYGVSLKNYGIACNKSTHTYCFVNRIAADGTNAIWLYVDGEEIAPLTEYYVNSTLTDANSHDLSGKDFVLSYIGTSDFAIKGCVIDGIRVVETGYDPSIHLHTWSEWETESLPSSKGPGMEQRTCAECGKIQKREVEGVWQKYDLDEHMADLPEVFCTETNLWSLLPHDREYYHSGVRWDVNGNVHSVTFAVSGGEHIFATSFGKRGTNGTTSSDGIRLTFFGENGVLKTTSPQETYAEFVANGGYIIVPEGAVAVNIPMYSNSDENELYILNRDHRYENGICSGCGHALQMGTITKSAWTMSLDSVIYLNYYVKMDGFAEDLDFGTKGGVVIWNGDEKPTASSQLQIGAENCTVVKGMYYNPEYGWGVKSHEIYAKNLGDMVYVRPYVEVADGVYVYGSALGYSPERYCQDMLKNENERYDTRRLCAALLEYGAAAQLYFDYKTDDLVNEGLDLIDKYELSFDGSYLNGLNVTDHARSLVSTLDGVKKGVTYKKATLNLQGAIRMSVGYDVSLDWTQVEKAEVLFWTEDQIAKVDSLAYELQNYSYKHDLRPKTAADTVELGDYRSLSDHILAKNLGKTMFYCCRIVMKDGTVYRSGLNAYGPEAFLSDHLKTATGEIGDLCRKIAVYGEMARQRFS